MSKSIIKIFQYTVWIERPVYPNRRHWTDREYTGYRREGKNLFLGPFLNLQLQVVGIDPHNHLTLRFAADHALFNPVQDESPCYAVFRLRLFRSVPGFDK